jgi:hypothetical protein
MKAKGNEQSIENGAIQKKKKTDPIHKVHASV